MGCCSKEAVQVDTSKGVAPASVRKCRDCLCCVFFLVFWVGMLAVALIGVINGDPKRLLYGVDYNGTTCGTGELESKTLIFYPRINQDLTEALTKGTSALDVSFYGVCVDKCPEVGRYFCNYEAEKAIQAAYKDESDREKGRKSRATSLLGTHDCWFVAMASETTFFRCIQMTESTSTSVETCLYPGDSDEYYTMVNGVRKTNSKCQVKKVQTITDSTGPAQSNAVYDQLQGVAAIVGRCIGDIQNTWPLILVCGALIAFVLGFVFMMMLRCCAGCFIWLVLWLFVLLLLVVALLFSTKGGIINDSTIQKVQDSLNNAGIVTAAQNGLSIPENLKAQDSVRKAYAAAAYVFYVLTGIALLLVCFFSKKIRVTIGIIKESSKAIARLPLLLVFPVVPFIMMIILFIYSAVIAAFVYSTQHISLSKLPASEKASAIVDSAISKTSEHRAMQIMLAYHFFGFLWTNQLINAISLCTIAGAVCRYYWSRNKNAEEMGRFPILYSFKNCFRYHFGSLAFGSFIIAVVQFIRAVLMYIDHQTQDIQKSNLMVRVAMKGIQCCLWCFEKCLKFLSKNAYIMVAMKGCSFCTGAKEAFKVIFCNAAQIATVSMLNFLLLSAGKIAVSLISGILMYLFLQAKKDDYGIGGTKEISSPLAPIILTLILAWFVSSTLLGVYEMTIDTILLCYCEDKDLNKESGAYFMSDELRQFVTSLPAPKSAAAGPNVGDGGGVQEANNKQNVYQPAK